MWTTVERTIDGAVGRLLSWWVQPAIRPIARAPVARIKTDAGKTGADQTSTAAAERGRESSKVIEANGGDKNAESAAIAVELTVQGSAEAASSVDDSILEALATNTEGLAMKDLTLRTGAKRHALRRSLNRLMADGRVLRKGEGMRTCYHVRSG